MKRNVKITIAHLGARKHYQEPCLFSEWGILEKFYTDFYAGNNLINKILRSTWLYPHLPTVFKKMLGRFSPHLDPKSVIHFPLLGISYFHKLKKASEKNIYDIHISIGQEFNRKIIASGMKSSTVVYGFNSASLELFEYAKTKNIKCILDQTLAKKDFECKLLLEEEENWPGWSKYVFHIYESTQRLQRRETQEQELADYIVCGSDFVKNTLIDSGIKPDKISVIPLGFNQNLSLSRVSNLLSGDQSGNPLKILFAGSVGLRKGIPYLLDSLKILHNHIPFECKLAGSIEIKLDKIQEHSKFCNFLGRVPRSEMEALYKWADVFVLPSICEGSAMVTYEAMSYGLPIITTYNSGSIIRDKVDGFLVPIRDSNAIAKSLIEIFYDRYQFTEIDERINYLKSVNEDAQNNLRNLILSCS